MRLSTGLLVAALSGLAACGSDEAEAPAAAPSVSAAPAETTPTETISVPWRLAGADGVLLEIRVAGAGCVSFQNLDVEETATKVTIAAQAVKDSSPGTFCSQEVTTEQAPQALEKPLGKRKLVHAPISEGWDGPKTLGADKR